MSACKSCGSSNMTLTDHQPLAVNQEVSEDWETFLDNQIYGSYKCLNCGAEGDCEGTIEWEIKD